MFIETILRRLFYVRKTLAIIVGFAILLLVLAIGFHRLGRRFDILNRQERESQGIKKSAEEHKEHLRGNPSEMAREAFGSKPEDAKMKDARSNEQKKKEQEK
jgi:hypothetical protein